MKGWMGDGLGPDGVIDEGTDGEMDRGTD